MFYKIRKSPIIAPFKEFLRKYFFGFYKNVFRTNYKKNILISFITHPIKQGLRNTHSNYLELFTILNVFKDLKFNIDVADYRYEGKINYDKYDLIFGFGYPFGKSFWDKKSKKSLKICYLTGSLKLFNQMERNRYLKERRGKAVIPRRDYYHKFLQESISMSDAVIFTGNDWTKSSIELYNSRVYKVRLPVFLPNKNEIKNIIEKKDFEESKKHFLWFGSSGALHKGLDLCLDVFAKEKELFLHICGPVDKEEDFFELYKKELTELSNISYYGFVNIESPLFKNIINSCSFSIFPSCSEGGGGSLLTTMAYGLIPIATLESSVDIKQDYGFLLEDYKTEYISEILKKVSALPNEILKNMALKSMEYVHINQREEAFKEDLLNALKSLGL